MSRTITVETGPSRREIGLAAMVVFAVLGSVLSIILTARSPDFDMTRIVMSVYGSVMFMFVGVVVLWRRPGHGIGRLAIVIGLLFTASTAIRTVLEWWQPGVGVRTVLFGPMKALYDVADSVSNLLAVAGLIAGVVLLVTWFPDGRRTSRLGAVVELTLAVGVVAVTVASLRDPILQQVGWTRTLDDMLTMLSTAAIVAFVGAWFGSVVDLILRYRRADVLRRTQMRWVVVAAAVSAGLAAAVLVFGERIPWALAILGLGLPVFAVAIAITRYHLYDIDRIVSNSISYLAVTTILFVVFGASILVLSPLISGAVAGPGSKLDPRVVAASTLVVAAMFNPLRTRVQSIVDRRFHRARYDAERTVESFAGRLRDQLDLPTLTIELRRTAIEAVEPDGTAVWLRIPGGTR